MKKINDEVFGQMTYDYQWERPVEETLWGRRYNILLTVESETDDDNSISCSQRLAYESFVAQHAELEPVMLNALVQYCQNELKENDCSAETFLTHNAPTSIYFPLSGGWAIMFNSEYDEEAGLAAVVRNDQVEVGSQDIIL